MKDSKLPNFRNMDANSGSIYGKHNTVRSVNPYNCYFIAHYDNGKVKKGNNLFDTGWDQLKDGITKLQYKLSNGNVVEIPKFKAYMHLVEVSQSIEGARIFHSVNIKGLGDGESINYKIVLKEDNISKYKIGDIIVSKDDKIMQSPQWKMAAF